LRALISPFVNLCLLRVAPQDLPASWLLVGLTLVAYTLSGVLVSNVSLSTGHALLAGLTDTGLLCVLTVSLLYVQRVPARLPQTLTALAGTGTLFGVVALPVTSWLHTAHQAGEDTSLPALLLVGLIGWSLAVAAHILRHALSTVFFLGLVIAIAFYWISLQVLGSLFPVGV